MSKIIESIENKLSNFAKFLEVVKGKEDAKIRPNIILDPSNKLTTSNLTAEQLDFVTSAYFMQKWFPEAKPLKDYAEIFLQASESKDGWAVQKIIEHEQALGEKRMMALGLRPGQPQQEQGKMADKSMKAKE